MIRLKDLSIGFNEVLLHSEDIQLEKGNVYALVGANGRGKTTLLKTLNGVLKPISGELLIDSISVNQLTREQLARKIAFVSSKFEGVDHLTVYQYVALGRTPYLGLFGRLTPSDHQVVTQAIEQLGLSSFTQRITAELSDGERQMASIARALAQDCPIITLDEPTAFLDYTNKAKILDLLSSIAVSQGKCILFSTHDLDLIHRQSIPVLLAQSTKKLHLLSKYSSVHELIKAY
jgi:iron complex transport system ATP-binding protein